MVKWKITEMRSPPKSQVETILRIIIIIPFPSTWTGSPLLLETLRAWYVFKCVDILCTFSILIQMCHRAYMLVKILVGSRTLASFATIIYLSLLSNQTKPCQNPEQQIISPITVHLSTITDSSLGCLCFSTRRTARASLLSRQLRCAPSACGWDRSCPRPVVTLCQQRFAARPLNICVGNQVRARWYGLRVAAKSFVALTIIGDRSLQCAGCREGRE